MVALVAAAEPNCLVGSIRSSIEVFTKSFEAFCNNQSPTAFIDGIGFTSEGSGCEQATCAESFNKIAFICSFNRNIISGSGDIATDGGCGKYTFQIGTATRPGLAKLSRSVFGNGTTSNTTISQLPPANSTILTPTPLPTLTPEATVTSQSSPPAAAKSTAAPLPTGGSSIAKVSGCLILGVASIFVMFL